jgi:hypothetical protein
MRKLDSRSLDYLDLAIVTAVLATVGALAWLLGADDLLSFAYRIRSGLAALIDMVRSLDVERYADGSIALRACLPGSSDDCGA